MPRCSSRHKRKTCQGRVSTLQLIRTFAGRHGSGIPVSVLSMPLHDGRLQQVDRRADIGVAQPGGLTQCTGKQQHGKHVAKPRLEYIALQAQRPKGNVHMEPAAEALRPYTVPMSILVIEHSAISRANRLGTALTRHGHRLDTRRLHQGDPLPTDVRGLDGLVIMGSPDRLTDGTADASGPAEMRLARQAHEAGIPIVGICFGCQILTAALGGTVSPLADGVRVGMHDVTQTMAGHVDPLLAGLPWSMPCLHWNNDVASTLPPDAVCLAKGPAGDHQAWRLGVRTYAFQFHPEMTPATIDAIIAEDRPDLDRAGVTEDAVRAQVAQAWPAYRRLTDRLLDAIAMLLMPIDLRTVDVVRGLRH